ncbi:MAG: Glu-tRNA(Gln) amidotransferase subunit GatE [Polyangiaceae bacterium]
MSSRRFRATAPPPSPHDLNPRREPILDFPDREFGELSPRDYELVGFMCGLEVHQQLETRRKLFCRCASGRRVTRIDNVVLRHMRPTLSEMGQYDGCALMEFKTRKEIVYLLERGTVCTYEMDDTPPFEIDAEAVKIALEVSTLFGLNLVNELHVMRKQYLDGSIPTGFQRTAMIGTDGVIPFRESELGGDRMLRIRQLTLEEDSCREVSDVGHRITFRTDRLGTPLIETVTEPDLLTPQDVAAGGRLLADVARACAKVRRGAGAARQDVNVSVAGGRRVELKGVPSQRLLPRLVHNEAFRQLNLLRIAAELSRRGLEESLYSVGDVEWAWASPRVVDATSLLKKTEYPPLKDALERGHRVLAIRLTGIEDLLSHRTQPEITFSHELSERVRVIACLEARPFMISSSVAGYGLGPSDWRHLRSALSADTEDGIVVVWGPDEDVDTAAREILSRVREAFRGVPSETRQAFADGTTGFERILPGAERMYPDTDTPPVPIIDGWVQEIEAALPERPWQTDSRFVALGLDPALAARATRAEWRPYFEAASQGASPTLARAIAAALDRTWHRAKRKRRGPPPSTERMALVVSAFARGELPLFALESAVEGVLSHADGDGDKLLAALRVGDATSALEQRIAGLASERKELRSRDPAAGVRWAMGRALEFLRGRVDPRLVRERVENIFAIPGAQA